MPHKVLAAVVALFVGAVIMAAWAMWATWTPPEHYPWALWQMRMEPRGQGTLVWWEHDPRTGRFQTGAACEEAMAQLMTPYARCQHVRGWGREKADDGHDRAEGADHTLPGGDGGQ